MLYGEASYFDGYAFAHIAAWEDHKRLLRKLVTARRLKKERERYGRRYH